MVSWKYKDLPQQDAEPRCGFYLGNGNAVLEKAFEIKPFLFYLDNYSIGWYLVTL